MDSTSSSSGRGRSHMDVPLDLAIDARHVCEYISRKHKATGGRLGLELLGQMLVVERHKEEATATMTVRRGGVGIAPLAWARGPAAP